MAATRLHSTADIDCPTLELVHSVRPAGILQLHCVGGRHHFAVTGPVEATFRASADVCLPDLLREHARLRPEAVAVVHGRTRLTYRELTEASSLVGSYLRDLGVGADDCVGLFAQRSHELLVGAWGILFAGGAYLPLAPEYPEDRLRYMIEHSRSRVIVCQHALTSKLSALAPRDVTIVSLDDAQRLARRRPAAELHAGSRSADLAYVIYTSGSTGKPKGVMVEQRSIVNQMRWLASEYGIGAATVILQKTPMSFDAAQWEILAPSCGARVVVGGPDVHRDPEGLLRTIAEHDVTTLQCVPTLLQALVDTEALDGATSLRQIFSGGEALSRSLALRCMEALPGCALVNLYGPTECTINASAFTVDPAAIGTSDTASIGRPVANTAYHILTPSRTPVADGEAGELYISGLQLARGYLHRPDLTADRFVANPFSDDPGHDRLYKSGDLARWNADGTVQFVGRTDNQVKLRGFRIELDEIRLAIENHDWIRHAGVIVNEDPASGFQSLLAFIELNPAEAALMDQGNHGAHHQSKESKLQLKAQLSNLGCRSDAENAGKTAIELPNKAETERQRRRVFARKTYRFYEGGEVTRDDILRLLDRRAPMASRPRGLDALSLVELGEILRYFGQYLSLERLLPKYGYASPGALYATQMYLELRGIAALAAGLYYFHPVEHRLVLIRALEDDGAARLKVHFIGKTSAITPVYETNVQEVLAMEAGHMVGLFDAVLPEHGLTIEAAESTPALKVELGCSADDYYLAAFEVLPYAPAADEGLEIYVQAHPGRVAGLPAGQYVHEYGELRWLSYERVLRKHVIAINQQTYDRASFGITVMCTRRDDQMSYVALGRALQRLMMNDLNLGFMSSGYSSRTGRPLPSARRLNSILTDLGRPTGPSYFFVGGRVGDEQLRSEGMKEDAVHMKGPAEMVKDDLVACLPDYMVPNKVVVLDKLPLTPNGKVDTVSLAASYEAGTAVADRPFVAPRTATEERVSAIWQAVTKHDAASVQDDFFEFGGNSLMAVSLVNKINREFGSSLPLQMVFQAPTVEQLAAALDSEHDKDCSRLVPLRAEGSLSPVFCWPGLGGYTMNLRSLAEHAHVDRPVYGVQAHGINVGERPYATVEDMAAEDVKAIRCLQPQGPYTLWGYSFGARVAFETAFQLEQSGAEVEHLFLIAPGSPKVKARDELAYRSRPAYRNDVYRTILFSVFAGSITHPALKDCLAIADDEESFAAFVCERFPELDPELVRRVIEIVGLTYNFKYEFHELSQRRIDAPITIFKARGDDYAFIEGASGYCAQAPTVIELDADHYGLLKEPGIHELVRMIRYRLLLGRRPRPQSSAAADGVA